MHDNYVTCKMRAWVRPRPLEKRGLVSFLPGNGPEMFNIFGLLNC